MFGKSMLNPGLGFMQMKRNVIMDIMIPDIQILQVRELVVPVVADAELGGDLLPGG